MLKYRALAGAPLEMMRENLYVQIKLWRVMSCQGASSIGGKTGCQMTGASGEYLKSGNEICMEFAPRNMTWRTEHDAYGLESV